METFFIYVVKSLRDLCVFVLYTIGAVFRNDEKDKEIQKKKHSLLAY